MRRRGGGGKREARWGTLSNGTQWYEMKKSSQ
jgi:hypothetical protein